MPSLLEISGLLGNGLGAGLYSQRPPGWGRGVWWGALSRKIDAAIRGQQVPYDRQEAARAMAKDFEARFEADASPPDEGTRQLIESQYPRGIDYYRSRAAEAEKYGTAPKGAFGGLMSFLSAAGRQAPVFTAEKCLEIAERLVAKGNKRMAYLWALRAAKTAQREKKPELQKRAQELAARLKAELAVQAVAGFGGECCSDVGSLSQDVIQHTLTLVPVLQKMADSEDFPTRMLGMGIALTMVARKVANERKQKAIARIAERMIKAAKIARIAQELKI